MTTTVKRILFAVVGTIVVILLCVNYSYRQHQGLQFIHAVQDKHFYLEGYFGSLTSAHFTSVIEYQDGSDYGIKYPDRSYFASGSQYYIEDENGKHIPVTEKEKLVSIYSTASMFYNHDFSKLKFCCEGCDVIKNIETARRMFCHYEEYRFEDTADTLRLYFHKGELYAIQARDDAQYIYYVNVFSKYPQQYLNGTDAEEKTIA